jgi:hypothetical protein
LGKEIGNAFVYLAQFTADCLVLVNSAVLGGRCAVRIEQLQSEQHPHSMKEFLTNGDIARLSLLRHHNADAGWFGPYHQLTARETLDQAR